MAYSNEIYARALKAIRDDANQREQKYNFLLEQLYKDVPRLTEIDNALGRIGSRAAITALSGDMQALSLIQKDSEELQKEKQEILNSAGIKKPEPKCNFCNDTGYIGSNYCSCVKSLAKKMSFEELSKHMPLNNQHFDNFDLTFYPDKADKNGIVPRKNMTSVLKMAKEYAINFTPSSKSLLFIGDVGLGKTHLSLSIVSEVLAKGYDVVYGSAQNLFSAAEREHFSYTGESAKTDALLQCDLLVIDDLGTEFMTSFTQSLFYNIINTRLLSCKPTIINTNLNFKELEERYTPRITSRFMGEYKLVKFFGTDIRQQKMATK